MSNGQIQDDIIGRLRNTRLSKHNAAVAVFEAVANSMHAIEDAGRPGHIDVHILRSADLSLGGQILPPVIGFELQDNGIGYNEIQYRSFCTANSRLKLARGGKGVGRFLWLKTFREISIASTYAEDGKVMRRTFDFAAADSPIQNLQVTSGSGEPLTVVTLRAIRPAYDGCLPLTAEALADQLARHFLVSVMSLECPEIRVIDKAAGIVIDVKKRFQEQILMARTHEPFRLKEEAFGLTLVYLQMGSEAAHRLVLCAHGREVAAYPLHTLIPDLKTRAVPAPDGRTSEVWAVVSGEYLDRRINQDRTSFMFADSESADVDALDLTQKELHAAIAQCCRTQLRGFLATLGRQKLQRVEQYAIDEGPEYRVLLKHAAEAIMGIPLDIPENRLEAELHKILYEAELRLRQEGTSLLAERPHPSIEDAGYVERYEAYVNRLLDFRQSELARYVLHRRSIIDLLANALVIKPDGRFFNEDYIHKLLYPPRSTSDDALHGQQNLWLIDEKLSYHYYLASATQLSNIRVFDSTSRGRPDILVFDRPSAFVDSGHPFDSIIIVEMKRPQRTNYSGDDQDPCRKVYIYISDIWAGKVLDKNGNRIQATGQMRFYCYILADMTPQLRNLAKLHEFRETSDGLGYYKHSLNFNAYVEIISYQKMLADARRRNRVLFRKLGLPGYDWDNRI